MFDFFFCVCVNDTILNFIYMGSLNVFTGKNKTNTELHSPDERILQRQFINNLIVLAYNLYGKEHP